MNKIQNAVNPIKKGLGAFFVNRKVKISCLILIWGLVIIQTYVNFMDPGALRKHAVFSYDSYKKSKEAITAFSVIEDNATDKILKGFGYYKTDNMSEGEKRKLLIDFAKQLGIKDGYTFAGGEGSNYIKLELQKEGKYGTTRISCISLIDENSEPEQYIYLDIHVNSEEEKIYNLYQNVKNAYQNYGMNSNVNLEYTTSVSGNIETDNQERKQYTEKILDKLSAQVVDVVDTGDYHTVYAYTKNEKNSYNLNGKQVNIQIVFSYSETDDMTYIKIGCPIVNSSY